jgi:hypothetical protein
MDEPETLRGIDTGMNPVELLLCCLGHVTHRGTPVCQGKEDQFSGSPGRTGGRSGYGRLFEGKDGVRAGLREIRHTFHIRTDADEKKVRPKGIVINR